MKAVWREPYVPVNKLSITELGAIEGVKARTVVASDAPAPEEPNVYSRATSNIPRSVRRRNVANRKKVMALRWSADVLMERDYKHHAPLEHFL